MRNMILLFITGIALIGSGCSKVKQLANINVDIPYTQQVSVPTVAGYSQGVALPAGGATLSFPAVPVITNSKQYIAQYNTSADKILNVDMKSMTIDMVSPLSGQNFDFLDSIQLYISANGQSEQLVASQNSIPKGLTSLTLTTNTNVNLKNYFIQDTMYFRLSAHINATPLSGEQLNINTVFHVLANPLD